MTALLSSLGATAAFIAASAAARRAELVRERAGVPWVGTESPSTAVRRLAELSGAAALGHVVLGPAGLAMGPLVLWLAERLTEGKRARAALARRDEQLADAIGAITSAVRSGLSVPQAFAYAAEESEEPITSELELLVRDVSMGVPMSQAADDWAARVDTEDARLLVSVLELNRRSGGDLAAVLDQVGATIRERVAAAREVRALTAQARLSGLVLGLLPFGFFGFLWLTSRKDMQAALGTPAGVASVCLGLLLEGLAFLWIRRLLEVG